MNEEQTQVSDTIDIENSQLYICDIERLVSSRQKFKYYYEIYNDELYSLILLTLTHKSFNKKEAKQLCKEILRHKSFLQKRLKRDSGVCLATLDYLSNIKNIIYKPTIMEEKKSDFLTDSSTKDGLTNLYLRDIFDVFLKKEIDLAKRKNTIITLALIDIDDFKKINDNFGHQKGDEVLSKIGEILNDSIRQMDFAARYGGEELSIVMPNTKLEQGYKIANRVRKKIENLKFDDFSITVSIGLSQTSDKILDSEKIISCADKALYLAKEKGKNQVVKFKS
ncbi:GGDEF domain-containing protein [Malaciobacter canalis]|uniref:GGDEF domain-containing protein n=1 Tax=Malaciobacter canalis TaxID=1912871 RepID=UPI00384D03D7